LSRVPAEKFLCPYSSNWGQKICRWAHRAETGTYLCAFIISDGPEWPAERKP